MTDQVFSIIDRFGILGVGLLVALENLVPPVPSEAILPLAGFRSRRGAMRPVPVWGAATAGSLSGALILYWLGARLGYPRLHRLAARRWFVLSSQADLERGLRLFERHGSWIVAGARCVPVLRSLVSIPAGVVRMPLPRFVALTVLGSGIWNAAFIWAGWALAERWRDVDRYVAPVGTAVGAAVVVGVMLLAYRKIAARRRAAVDPGDDGGRHGALADHDAA